MRKGVDILVVGAGIFGLSCAWACARRGHRVLVIDRAMPGGGSSGGPVGALAPHPPERWNAKKALQLATLLGAEAHWAEIAAAGGGDPGYGRIGRRVPLMTPSQRRQAEAQAAEAARLWPAPLRWDVVDEGGPEGSVRETLSARLNPKRAIAALVAALAARGVEVRAGWQALEVGDGSVRCAQGMVEAGAVILATGADGMAPLARLIGRDPGGQAVKGQAALLAGRLAGPMITATVPGGSLYIVPHADGRVAVGSTSEARWDNPTATDAGLEALLHQARALCPALGAAPVVARWAGLRPRGALPEPMLGRLPGFERLFVANAGFRTGFGLAPAVGAILAEMVEGRAPELPPGFHIEDHLDARARQAARSAISCG